MNDEIQKCAACGSQRVVSVTTNIGPEDFVFLEEMKELGWWQANLGSLGSGPQGVRINKSWNARVCLDCGNGNTFFRVDANKVIKMLDKFGTDALKERLAKHGYAPVVIGIRVLVVLLMGALVGIPIV